MYKTILIPLDATEADATILAHIKPLARLCGAKLVLMHVADGWAARRYGPDAVSEEVTEDHAYLARLKQELAAEGLIVEAELAYGEPATEIIKWIDEKGCDLVAMSTHGHRFLADLFYGSTANKLRHELTIPILMLRVK